jgi:hypothetical protein
MKEELTQHLKDIIEDFKNSPLPDAIALEAYAESLLKWFTSRDVDLSE